MRDVLAALGLGQGYLADGAGLEVFNPVDGRLLAVVADYDVEQTQGVISAAEKSLSEWSGLLAKERADILIKWYNLILENAGLLAQIVTAECGKPLAESLGEVNYAASFVRWFAEEGRRVYGDVIPTHAKGKRILVIKQPVGVAAAITPWNFPVAMITRKVAPALAAGCPIIVKPAESTPLSALVLEVLARKAGVPGDTFRVIPTTRPEEIGSELCANPVIKKLSFTGSTAVGKKLMAKCATTVKKLSLELGGNAPFIVFDDADIDSAIDGALASKFRNAGQTCVCANRFLVQEGVYEQFIHKLTEKVDAFKVGDGAVEGVDVGPLINGKSAVNVGELVLDAVANGAVKVTQDTAILPGPNFYHPTVLRDVSPDMRIANEEIFGPIASIIPFRSEAEAVMIANDTPYGLAAYFYTQSLPRIWRVMESLEYGMVGVNDGMISTEVAPFGGVKESGTGREGSRYGIDEYIELKYCLLGGLSDA